MARRASACGGPQGPVQLTLGPAIVDSLSPGDRSRVPRTADIAMHHAPGRQLSLDEVSVSASLPSVGQLRTLGLPNSNGKYTRPWLQLSQLWTAAPWRRTVRVYNVSTASSHCHVSSNTSISTFSSEGITSTSPHTHPPNHLQWLPILRSLPATRSTPRKPLASSQLSGFSTLLVSR